MGRIRFGTGYKQLALAMAMSSLLAACVAPSEPPPRSTSRPPPVQKKAADRPVTGPQQKPHVPVFEEVKQVANPDRQIPPGLEIAIRDYWRAFPGKTGVAIQRIDGDWTVGERLDDWFPQQSVSKTWVALAVLEQVDQGRLRLDQTVHIGPDDLTLFYQPIRTRVLNNGGIDVTIRELLELSVTTSDCTANDSLARVAGGPEAVRSFIARKGLGRIRFGPGERLLQSGIAGLQWQQDYSRGRNFEAARAKLPLAQRQAALNRYLADPVDGASPRAIVGALAKLARGDLLSPASTRLMLDMMNRTRSGPNRLKAGLPAGWSFGHKTGTGQVLGAVSTGYNDIGIMTAPDGTRYAIAVMMADTTAAVPDRMVFMQNMSRLGATFHQR